MPRVDPEQRRVYEARHREQHRKQRRAQDRARHQAQRIPCPQCSEPMSPTSTLCLACRKTNAEQRRQHAAHLREQGVPVTSIAEALGTTNAAIYAALWRHKTSRDVHPAG